MRTLVVEDNSACMLFLHNILTEIKGVNNVEIDCATTGEEALQMFTDACSSDRPYKLMFMDIILPGMDGLQALEKIRAVENELELTDDQKVKAIITTALDDSTKASRAFFQGEAISYMTKPTTPEKIHEELSKFGFL
ncbi:two-component system, chemotaxis family, response regulator CheY [Maridesulfovibrio ferrireducens]|uniref:Two-component system, chemotaxis family, response regulator CheY n=1 Tax=Maridesulfovibrio ferrireducens TaxID=246191 RepID=A0A1G9FFU6_9BACT|nr:response regulator [Maridesulfovibrio ferrireducens]SDK87216.1 two-component system, chemotaxis family, response regulator CheY [Maridesulfovibrio ferrireducens]